MKEECIKRMEMLNGTEFMVLDELKCVIRDNDLEIENVPYDTLEYKVFELCNKYNEANSYSEYEDEEFFQEEASVNKIMEYLKDNYEIEVI